LRGIVSELDDRVRAIWKQATGHLTKLQWLAVVKQAPAVVKQASAVVKQASAVVKQASAVVKRTAVVGETDSGRRLNRRLPSGEETDSLSVVVWQATSEPTTADNLSDSC
jgi:hypothetical protein